LTVNDDNDHGDYDNNNKNRIAVTKKTDRTA